MSVDDISVYFNDVRKYFEVVLCRAMVLQYILSTGQESIEDLNGIPTMFWFCFTFFLFHFASVIPSMMYIGMAWQKI